MRENFEMVNGPVTIILEGGDSAGKFSFEGIKVETKPNVLYKPYVWGHGKKAAGEVTIVSLSEYIYAKLKVQADADLKDYIAEHINDTTFYKVYRFFDRYCSFKDTYPEIDENINLSYENIARGLVNARIARSSYCVFDLVQDKFQSIKASEYKDAKDKTPLQVFYGSMLDSIMAVEQYKRGIAHPAFTELVNLNKFLDGKKSVKLVMKSGKVHELKTKGSEVRASLIVEFRTAKFYLNTSYYMAPRFAYNTEVSELDYLQFGRQTYKIHTANLAIEVPKTKKAKTAS